MFISYKSTLHNLLNIVKLIIRLLHESDESFENYSLRVFWFHRQKLLIKLCCSVLWFLHPLESELLRPLKGLLITFLLAQKKRWPCVDKPHWRVYVIRSE